MYKDILFPVDLSEDSSWQQALPVVLEHAKAFGSTVHLMTVIPDSGMSMVSQYFSSEAVEKIVSETNEALHKFSKDNVPSEYNVQHIVTQGNVYQSIIDASEKIGADLIIMSAHRPELRDYLLGPNAARVVRHSNCSVLVVRGTYQ
jgi:nucleotide-binding universal stress UspA family protein